MAGLREDRATQGGRARPSMVMLIAGVVWIGANGSGLVHWEGATFVLLSGAALVATLYGVRTYKPRLRWPFYGTSIALVFFLVGSGMRESLGTLGDLTSNRSLVPDLLTIPGYVVLAASYGGLVRARRRDRTGRFEAGLDAAIASLVALALAWAFVIDHVLQNVSVPLSVRVTLAVYPPLSVFIVAIVAQLAFSPAGRRLPAYWLFLFAMSSMLVGDVIYMFVELGVVVPPRVAVDLPYALAYLTFAVCMLHPSMRELSEPVPTQNAAPKAGRLVFVAAALAVPVGVTIVHGVSTLGDRIVLGSVMVALTATACLRVFMALRSHARSEARLAWQATRDPLTGLPNRLATQEYVARALVRAASRGSHVALMYLDVDRFKLVNDTVGHTVGDELLVGVAQRLQHEVRPQDLVARVGGDEFVVIVDDVSDVTQALDLAERLRATFNDPFVLRGTETYASASFGVALANGSDVDADSESMIREADTAMYRAKEGGRDGIAVFDGSMRDRVSERRSLEHDLRRAIERGELSLVYQPIITLPGGPVETVEALLRWSHPTKGQISPTKFIPVAEETGLIVSIGEWALRQACQDAAGWKRELELAHELRVGVNISARQLRDPELVPAVESALADAGLGASALCLELTESLLIDEPGAIDVLRRLRALGVELSVDDFGTGYSSLAYLKRFPVHSVKIDKSFVDSLQREDTSDESLVAAIIAMASALGMRTIAEGIETDTQAQRVIELGCTAGQGYLYSRPVPAGQLGAVLSRLDTPVRPERRAGSSKVAVSTSESGSGTEHAASRPRPSNTIS